MIEHVVMWKFADTAEGKTREENMAIVRERLFALPAIIPEIKFMQIGYHIQTLVIILQLAPVAHSADVIAQGKGAGGLNAA